MKKLIVSLFGLFLLFGCQVTDNVLVKNVEIPISTKNSENIKIQEKTELVFVSPSNESKDILGKTPLTFLWNKPIFVLKNPGKLQKWLEQNITINPKIEGAWQVLGTTGILFEPQEEWEKSTRYEFQISEKITGELIKYAFETPRLKLEKIETKDLILKKPLIVYLNQAIKLEEAKKFWVEPEMKFEVQYHKKKTEKDGKEIEKIDKTIIEFIPLTDWEEDKKFILHIPEKISGEGNLKTKEEQTKEFKTIPPLTVKFNQYKSSVFESVSAYFSSPVSSEELLDYLEVDSLKDEAWEQYLKDKKENLSEWDKKNKTRYINITPPKSHWYPSKEQTITIKKGLKDEYGRALKEDQIFTFTPVFPNTVRPIYFPHETKNYQTGTSPQYSLWYSGGIHNVSLEIQQFTPLGESFKKETFTKKLNWEKSPNKRTIVEFDLIKEFPQIADETTKLKQGWYMVKLLYVPEGSMRSSFHSLNSEFGVGDFPVEMKHTANEKIIIKSNEKEPFDAIVFTKNRNNINRSLEKKAFYKNNKNNLEFDAKIYPEKIVWIYQNEKIGIGSTSFQKGMNPYDAPVTFSPYRYNREQTGVVFTDRPLFRPGDTVFFKSIFRDRKFFEKAFPLENVDFEKTIKYGVEIFNSRYEQVYSEAFETKGGSLDGEWIIPEEANLGQYRINIRLIGKENHSRFETTFYVTEYRKPNFLIDAQFETSKAIWKEDLRTNVSAEYAFGGNLSGKKVNYTVSLFGHKKQYWYWHQGSREDKLLTSGKSTLDATGKLQIPIKLDIELDDDINWDLVNLDVTVEGSPSEKSSKTISIPFFQSNEKMELKRNRYFYQQKDEIIKTEGKITNLEDEIIKNKKLTAQLFQKKWVRNDRKGGDGEFVGEWKEVETEIELKNLKSDKEGQFGIEFDRPEKSGEYFIRISSKDKKSRITKAENHFWVWTDKHEAFSLRQNDVNRILSLFNDKDSYEVGDQAKILFPHDKWKIDKVHATIERGTVLETLDANLENNTVSFEIEPWMTPNVFVSILIEGVDEKGIPQVLWGTIKVPINDTKHNLSIELLPEKTTYEPGEKAKMEIVTTVNGKPVSGEVTIAVVDQTLLALKARPKLELWQNFLTELPLGVQTYHSLANFMSEVELQEIYEKVKKIKAAAESPFGGGGGMGKGEEFKPRGDFRDTAAFLASVKTDEKGHATVEIPLADNLTKWNIWAVGHTNKNAFGEAEIEIQTTLPVLISPIIPNFFRAGDETNLGLLVRRNIKGSEPVKITMTLPSEIKGKSFEKTVLIKEERRIFFPVSVPYEKTNFPLEGKEIKLRFDIEGIESGFTDSVVLNRKIVPPIISVSAAEFLNIKESTDLTFETDEDALQSSLIVKVFGTLLDRLQKFVTIAKENNYRCAEQRFSYWTTRLLKNHLFTSIGKKTEEIKKEKLKKDRDFILKTQVKNGGFNFWESSQKPSEWLTTQVLEFAPIWEKFNTPFPKENLENASNWLKKQVLKSCAKNWCISESTRQYAAFILTKNKNFSKNNLEFLSDYTNSIEAKVWFVRTIDLFESQKETLPPKILVKKKEFVEELQRLMKARDRYVFWEEITEQRSFYSQNERLTAIVFEWLLEKDLLESYHAKIARYLTETKSKLSGNSALRILTVLNKYSEKKPKNNFPLNFSIKNLEKKIKTGTLKTATEKAEFEKIIPAKTSKTLTFNAENKKQFYTDIELHEIFAAEDLLQTQKGFWIEREIYEIDDLKYKRPIKKLKVGKFYLVRINIISNTKHQQVVIEDTIPAGVEGINFDLENTDKTLESLVEKNQNRFCYGWCTPRLEHQEFYFDKTRFFISEMKAGTHEFKYLIQARIKGEYEVLPVKVLEMYYPEIFATGNGLNIKIED